VLGDVARLPLASGTFDVASCRAAFHHFPRPDVVLREMVRVTRPGGRLLIADQISSEDPAKAALHNEIEKLCDPTHERALADSELRDMFASLGLAVAFRGQSKIDYSVAEWRSRARSSARCVLRSTAIGPVSPLVSRTASYASATRRSRSCCGRRATEAVVVPEWGRLAATIQALGSDLRTMVPGRGLAQTRGDRPARSRRERGR